MTIHTRSGSISPVSATQLYKGVSHASDRLEPHIALRILCRVRWNSKRPGLQAVTDEHVLVQKKGGGGGGGGGDSAGKIRSKEEVRDMIAKVRNNSETSRDTQG
ncbi:uncharacterized protein PG986_008525 [Apiospora aurea]|uniref:Uncharacterized protein n=1 Tax=Apiospora aurea TaxID=335848 RepID=A0ABR1QFP0_9PEZI